MPCRNAGPFLIPAVRSVLTQPECLELLVADGGSTDGTLQVLDEMAAYDSRVRLVSRADAGPADALNKAFRVARGPSSVGSILMTSMPPVPWSVL